MPFDYQVGGSLFGYPIVEVNNPNVAIRLPSNITLTADLSDGPVDLAMVLARGAAYVPPEVPTTIG